MSFTTKEERESSGSGNEGNLVVDRNEDKRSDDYSKDGNEFYNDKVKKKGRKVKPGHQVYQIKKGHYSEALSTQPDLKVSTTKDSKIRRGDSTRGKGRRDSDREEKRSSASTREDSLEECEHHNDQGKSTGVYKSRGSDQGKALHCDKMKDVLEELTPEKGIRPRVANKSHDYGHVGSSKGSNNGTSKKSISERFNRLSEERPPPEENKRHGTISWEKNVDKSSFSESRELSGARHSESRSRPSLGRRRQKKSSSDDLQPETDHNDWKEEISSKDKDESFHDSGSEDWDQEVEKKNEHMQHIEKRKAVIHNAKVNRGPNRLGRTTPNEGPQPPAKTSTGEKKGGLIVMPTAKLAEEMKESARPLYLGKVTKSIKESHQDPAQSPSNVSSGVGGVSVPKQSPLPLDIDSTSIFSITEGKRNTLESIVSCGLHLEGALARALQLSFEICSGCSQIILSDLSSAFQRDVENYMWKHGCYILINYFREFIEQQSVSENDLQNAKTCFWNFLRTAEVSFQHLLTSLQQRYGFDLRYFVSSPFQQRSISKQLKLALRSCHLILIFLGDLHRYFTDLRQDNNYATAVLLYQQAICLAPKNGKCYNQLGVIAVLCKHKLDAVYFYIRSLLSTNPIPSARERLTGIFQEIARKVAQLKHPATNQREDPNQQSKWSDVARLPKPKIAQSNNAQGNDHIRDEVWVFFRNGRTFKVMLMGNGTIKDLTPNLERPKDSTVEQSKLQLKEVNRRFLLHFLFVHSKLYSRIEFETFTAAHQEAIAELKTLLRYPQVSSLKHLHLLKYMAINIFSIGNLENMQEGNSEVVPESPLDSGIVFAMDFYATLAENCVALLTDSSLDSALRYLDQYLPACRIWLRWLSNNCPVLESSSVRRMTDIWEKVASFANAVQEAHKIFDGYERSDELLVLYPEDAVLAGFKPLLSSGQPSLENVIRHEHQAVILHVQRLQSLRDLLRHIASVPGIPLMYTEEETFRVDQQAAVSISPTKNSTALDIDENSIDDQEVNCDVIIEEDVEDSESFSPQLSELKARKQALSNELAEQEQLQNEREALLQVHSSKGRVVSENHPHYIIPDTNCFIEHLPDLQKLINCNEFTVVVPIIVVSELDGLRGNNLMQPLLQAKARDAIEFLENRFGEKDSCLRAITSKGNELDTIAFRNEDYSQDKGNNDDVILSCCLHYCDEAVNKTGGGEPLRIQRKVVLLTDDRNLRLKAHSRYVPTVAVPVFNRLAKLDH